MYFSNKMKYSNIFNQSQVSDKPKPASGEGSNDISEGEVYPDEWFLSPREQSEIDEDIKYQHECADADAQRIDLPYLESSSMMTLYL